MAGEKKLNPREFIKAWVAANALDTEHPDERERNRTCIQSIHRVLAEDGQLIDGAGANVPSRGGGDVTMS